MADAVEHPDHYSGNGSVECMDAIGSMLDGYERGSATHVEAYWAASAVKYLWRWPLKGGAEDVRKARQCLDYLLGEMAGE